MTKYSYENVDAALSAAIEMLRHIQGGGHYDAFDFYDRMNALQETNNRHVTAAHGSFNFIATIARMTQDGEEVNGKEFVMENDDAVATLNALIDGARDITAKATGQ